MQITDFRTIADIVISIVVLPLFQWSKAVYTEGPRLTRFLGLGKNRVT